MCIVVGRPALFWSMQALVATFPAFALIRRWRPSLYIKEHESVLLHSIATIYSNLSEIEACLSVLQPFRAAERLHTGLRKLRPESDLFERYWL